MAKEIRDFLHGYFSVIPLTADAEIAATPVSLTSEGPGTPELPAFRTLDTHDVLRISSNSGNRRSIGSVSCRSALAPALPDSVPRAPSAWVPADEAHPCGRDHGRGDGHGCGHAPSGKPASPSYGPAVSGC